MRVTKKHQGFTIIEVMIVLAIAGLILLIVFIAVPALQRNGRNYDRKDYTGQIYAQMNEFYTQKHRMPGSIGGSGNFTSPANQTEVCDFLKSLPRVSSGASCGTDHSSFTSSFGGTFSADCVTIQASSYTICYQNQDNVEHGYIGPPDQILIMLGHWCNQGAYADPGQPAWWPVAGNDTNLARYAIWTSLEHLDQPLCLDNYASTF
jgi:prepilin-type N-terminal cleavage/methylation domain-containing protein